MWDAGCGEEVVSWVSTCWTGGMVGDDGRREAERDCGRLKHGAECAC